jgi:hypothetical protein
MKGVLLSLAAALVLALTEPSDGVLWLIKLDTVCGCAEGNSRNWPASNPNGNNSLVTKGRDPNRNNDPFVTQQRG